MPNQKGWDTGNENKKKKKETKKKKQKRDTKRKKSLKKKLENSLGETSHTKELQNKQK